ncbi:hypothetical protein HYU11_01835 [Candidatus Woesearchaeota archaeon]|nr:hypothetical protein [Candidatus Woesearchaeota archaeon]
MKIYLVGNPLLPSDSIPLMMAPELRKEFPNIEFAELDPSEEFPESKRLIIIDTVEESDKVRILDDVEKISKEPRHSPHDFGIGTHIKLMKKLGRLDNALIICVPQKMRFSDALKGVKEKIRRISSSLP